MKFAAIRDLQLRAGKVVEATRRGPVIITLRGKPTAALTALSEDDLEEFLFEHSPTLRRRIEVGLAEAKRGAVLSHAALKQKLLSRVAGVRKTARKTAGRRAAKRIAAAR